MAEDKKTKKKKAGKKSAAKKEAGDSAEGKKKAEKRTKKKAKAKKNTKKKAKTKKKTKKAVKKKKGTAEEEKKAVESEEKAKPKKDAAEKKKAAEEKTPKKEEKKDKPKQPKEVAKIKYLPDESKKTPKTTPRFNRQELGRLPRLDDKWRRPRGIDSKKHEKKRGKGALPSIGYKKPDSESGLHYGYEAVRVFNPDGLKEINPEKQAAVIASAVGRRKRNMIIEEANKLKITVLNPRRGEA